MYNWLTTLYINQITLHSPVTTRSCRIHLSLTILWWGTTPTTPQDPIHTTQIYHEHSTYTRPGTHHKLSLHRSITHEYRTYPLLNYLATYATHPQHLAVGCGLFHLTPTFPLYLVAEFNWRYYLLNHSAPRLCYLQLQFNRPLFHVRPCYWRLTCL